MKLVLTLLMMLSGLLGADGVARAASAETPCSAQTTVLCAQAKRHVDRANPLAEQGARSLVAPVSAPAIVVDDPMLLVALIPARVALLRAHE